MPQSLRHFLAKLAVVALGFIVILCILGLAAEYRLYRNTHHQFYSPQADWDLRHPQSMQVLFIGNSRTQVHVDMTMMLDHYQIPMYSLTQSARRLSDLWFKFKKYSEYNSLPKVIVLQCDQTTLISKGYNKNTFYGKEKFLTYLFADRIGINDHFKHETGFKWFETYIPLIRYIPYPEFFKMHWRGKAQNPYDKNNYFGAKLIDPKPGIKLEPLKKSTGATETQEEEGDLNFNYVDTFSRFCNQHNIKLICVNPPQSWASFQQISLSRTQAMAAYFNSKHINFKNFCSPNYAADSLFHNHLHLNKIGTKKYTFELIQYLDSLQLKQYLSVGKMPPTAMSL